MIVRALTHPIPRAIIEELEAFERQFSYPLGPADHFSISHGSEYLPFFAAMGTATLLVAEQCGSIVGTLVLVRRQLAFRDTGSGVSKRRSQEAHYFCDLKVRPDSRSGYALFRLMMAAADRIRSRRSQACYGIVMSGTRADPAVYTGRLSIPKFTSLGEIAVLRFTVDHGADASFVPSPIPGQARGLRTVNSRTLLSVTQQQFRDCEERLSHSGIQPAGGESSLRSELPVERFCHVESAACGLLEDTRRGKRLIRGTGEEIVSAHLSRFAWSDPAAAAEVLKYAVHRSRELGYPGMFCSLPSARWSQLKPLVHELSCQEAAATVYGYQIPMGLDWWIDTSEI